MDVYLRAGRDIPTDIFVEAISILVDQWTYQTSPLPGDIRRVASEIVLCRRREQRERRRQREIDEDKNNAMTPAQAKSLMCLIESEPEPNEIWKRTAREFSLHALRRVIARGEELSHLTDGLSDDDLKRLP